MIKYKILVSEPELGKTAFEKIVEGYLKNGWELQGGVQVDSNGLLYQAVTKSTMEML